MLMNAPPSVWLRALAFTAVLVVRWSVARIGQPPPADKW
jgi:hypothetical protein